MIGLNLGNVVVHLRANTVQFERAMLRSQALMQATALNIRSIGRRLSLYATTPLTLFGGIAVGAFARFDDAMTQSVSIMDGVTASIRAQMEEQARALSGNSIKSATELARSYYYLASAGMSAHESMAALPVVLKFATAGMFDMAEATDLLTDAAKAFGMQNNEISRMGDAIVLAAKQSNDTVRGFSSMLTADAAVAARGYRMELETLMAVLAGYAGQGKKAAMAGNMLGRSLRLLTKSYRQNAAAFEHYGIRVVDETTGAYRNFIDVIGDMERAFGGMTAPMRDAALEQLGFAALAQKAILPLIGISEEMRRFEQQQRSAFGTMEQVAARQMESFGNQIVVMKNKLHSLAILIGEQLQPLVKKLMDWVLKMAEAWYRLGAPTQEFIIKIGIAASVMGPLLISVSAFIFMMRPFTSAAIMGANAIFKMASGFVYLSAMSIAAIPTVVNAVKEIAFFSAAAFLSIPAIIHRNVIPAFLIFAEKATYAFYMIPVYALQAGLAIKQFLIVAINRAAVALGVLLATSSIGFAGLVNYTRTAMAATVSSAVMSAKAMALSAMAAIKAGLVSALVAVKTAFVSAIPMIISVATAIATYIVPIVAVAAAGITVFGAAAAAVSSKMEGGFAKTFSKLISGAKEFGQKALGFFYNFGANVDILIAWLKGNWEGLVRGILIAFKNSFMMAINNQKVIYKLLGRLTVTFLAWTSGRLMHFFVHEFPGLAWRGIKKVGSMFVSLFKRIGKLILAVLTGDFDAIDKYVKEIIDGFQTGMKGESFLGQAGGIIQEEMQNFQFTGQLDGAFTGMRGPQFRYDRPGQRGPVGMGQQSQAMQRVMLMQQRAAMMQQRSASAMFNSANGMDAASNEMERLNALREEASGIMDRFMSPQQKINNMLEKTREMLRQQMITADVAGKYIAEQVREIRGTMTEASPAIATGGHRTSEAYSLMLDLWRQGQQPKDTEIEILRTLANESMLARQLLQEYLRKQPRRVRM